MSITFSIVLFKHCCYFKVMENLCANMFKLCNKNFFFPTNFIINNFHVMHQNQNLYVNESPLDY